MRIILALIAALAILQMTIGCASLENKAVGIASDVDAIKVETVGGASTGTILPNLIIGGAQNSLATSPVSAKTDGATNPPVLTYTYRNSFFGSIFGINCGTETFSYIGTVGESADDTVKRLSAAKAITKISDSSDKKE